MEKLGTVKSVQSNGSWDGNFGTMYKFEIAMDTGNGQVDVGEYSSKSETQTKFIEGESTHYEFVDGKFPKIKPVYAGFNALGTTDAVSNARSQATGGVSRDLSIIRQSSLKAAIEFAAMGGCGTTTKDVTDVAEIFVNWVNGEAKEQRVEKAKKAVKDAVEKINKSDLPF